MGKVRAAAICLLASVLVSGCTHSVHRVAVAGIDNLKDLQGSWPVEAEAEQFVILGIATNTDFADNAYARLLDLCEHGALRAIEARHSTSHGFLSYTNRVKMRALCFEP
ncbi:MAG: hypothetical protein OXU20_22585 [Myxococcales bacterium]|nr:hypothetical protein [Myxococcales bacterium]